MIFLKYKIYTIDIDARIENIQKAVYKKRNEILTEIITFMMMNIYIREN